MTREKYPYAEAWERYGNFYICRIRRFYPFVEDDFNEWIISNGLEITSFKVLTDTPGRYDQIELTLKEREAK